MTTCCSKAVRLWSINPWCILWPFITKLKICSAENPHLNSCHVLSTNRHTPCASQGYHSRTLLHWTGGSCKCRTNFICNKNNLGSGSFCWHQKLTCHCVIEAMASALPKKRKALRLPSPFFWIGLCFGLGSALGSWLSQITKPGNCCCQLTNASSHICLFNLAHFGWFFSGIWFHKVLGKQYQHGWGYAELKLILIEIVHTCIPK